MTVEDNGTVITDIADPQAVSFTPETKEANPVEAAMQEMEKDGAKFGDENDATPEADDKAKEPEKKAEVKEKPEEKKPAPERGENGKFKKADAVETESLPEPSSEVDGEDGQEDEQEKRSSGERDIDRPPARFLPRAKEKWGTVDADVRGEVYRAFSEMEKGLEESRGDREFRKELRGFEDMAKKSNTSIPRVLNEYVEVYNQLRQDPASAVQRLLATVGITPQQYADHVLKTEQYHQANPGAVGQQQIQSEIQTLRNELAQERQARQQEQEELARRESIQQVENGLFNELRQDHPRFDELRQDVAFFFNSDKLSSIADERSRLYAAMDMAERVNPLPSSASERVSTATNRPLNPAGKKSVKGNPSGAKPLASSNLNGKEAIELAMRQMGL